MNPILTKISYFKNAKGTVPTNQITIADFLRGVMDGTHKAPVDEIRTAIDASDNDRARDLKLLLPAVSLSGCVTDGGRGQAFQEGRFAHSGWLQADFDRKDFHPRTPEEVKSSISADRHVQASFYSPTGGVKALVRIPVCATVAEHRIAFLAAEAYFKKTHDLAIDPATKDPVRFCFVSHDPEAFVRPTPALALPVATRGQYENATAARQAGLKLSEKPALRELSRGDVAAMLACIPPRPEYSEWLRIASAVWAALGEDAGTGALLQWSPEERPGEYSAKFAHRLKEVRAGTLIMLANEHGYRRSTSGPQPEPEPQDQQADAALDDAPPEVVRGFMDFPTHPPAEDVLAGDGQIRVTDIHMWNAPAGDGKSVAMSQTSMAWALNLPYCGIYPARPLKIIHFCGEDDESTLGQCREGFLLHSEAITGRRLTAEDLRPLDDMVRTDFSRQYTGDSFLRRLDAMLSEEHADLILINPLLSFIGGGIVETVSKFLREGLGPILKRHRCAALIAHHTCKLSKDSWENMDLTYSGIGGGEIANIPRSIFTLVPTKVNGLRDLHVAKRKLAGWKDDDGKFTDHAYFKRTDNPTRPAWLPVTHGEAEAMMAAVGSAGGGRSKKATIEHIVTALSTGAMQQVALIDWLMKNCQCSEKPCKEAIREASLSRRIVESYEKNPRGGHALKWLTLSEHADQGVGLATL